MARTNKKMTISKTQLITIEQAARRKVDIELGIGRFKHKAHKTAKDFNRKESKKIQWD